MIDLAGYEKFIEQSEDFIKQCARRLRRGTDPSRIVQSIEQRANDPYLLVLAKTDG